MFQIHPLDTPPESTKVSDVDFGPQLGLFLVALGPRPEAGYDFGQSFLEQFGMRGDGASVR